MILEWVPANDSQFVELCRGRQHLYGHLDEEHLFAELRSHFVVRLEERLTNGRSLWLLERC